jgi:hypothetical protein
MSGIPISCAHCGRPVASGVWIGQFMYHEECAHGPSWQQQQYLHPSWYAPREQQGPVAPLTVEDVRRIVREELSTNQSTEANKGEQS